MQHELDERKMKILQAIIRNYLETGEPVGSRTISKYTDLNLSSATANQILVYQGEPITAAFFSSCMSATTNAQDYWQNEVPYLRSVASPWDSETVDITRSKEVDDSTLTNTLGSSQLAVLSYYDNGYVKTVQAGSQQYTGRQIREMLGLASSCFTIERIENGLRFITYGSGHGIGMSQYGAQGMALAGYTYDEILHHYYTDVEIKTTLV